MAEQKVTVRDHLSLLTAEDKAVLTEGLKAWQASGVADPRIPMDVDVDGDGIVDAYALDAKGNLTVVSGIDLGDTVFASEGDDADPGTVEEDDAPEGGE